MKTSFKILAATAFLFVSGIVAPVQAAIVTASDSVTFEFDTSALGSTTLSSFSYSCSFEPTCAASGDSGRLALGASFSMDFGSTVGGSDIGTSTFANPFSFAINNVSTGLLPNQMIGAALDSLFVTFNFVDDAFGIDSVSLRSTGVNLSGTIVPVSPVPLPAGMLLLVGALGGLGAVSRRTKKRLV